MDTYSEWGVRRDALKWSILDDDRVISELEYHNVTSLLVRGGWRFQGETPLLFKVDVGLGEVFSGRDRDSDYLEPEKQMEYSRTRSELSGWVGSLEFTVGPPKRWISPLYGVALDVQVYNARNFHVEVLELEGGEIEAVSIRYITPGDHSTYRAIWATALAGVEVGVVRGENFELKGNLRGAVGSYFGEAKWRLRNDDFGEDQAFAAILKGGATLTWQLGKRWGLRASTEGIYGRALFGQVVYWDGAGCGFDDCRWWSVQALVGLTVNY